MGGAVYLIGYLLLSAWFGGKEFSSLQQYFLYLEWWHENLRTIEVLHFKTDEGETNELIYLLQSNFTFAIENWKS